MYQLKDKIYADAGYILKYNNITAFNLRDVNIKDVSEIKINLDDMYIKGRYIIYSDGNCRDYMSCNSYGDWKKKIVNKQFTNDDQIAIILNKDFSEEDLFRFNKMQEWRQWAGEVAKRIQNLCIDYENFKKGS